jgi:GGDEF domain-containing protein
MTHSARSVVKVDELTGLWNRSYFDLHLPPLLSMSREANVPLACVTADIDGLAEINRHFGENRSISAIFQP